MYLHGNGVSQNFEVAVEWFRRAAEKGDVNAYYYLGNCYYHGTGVSRNARLAISWFHKAARRGHNHAIGFFRKFAEVGYAESQLIMGLLYYEGQGVPQDYKEAVKWLRKASLKGHNGAQLQLENICNEEPRICEFQN